MLQKYDCQRVYFNLGTQKNTTFTLKITTYSQKFLKIYATSIGNLKYVLDLDFCQKNELLNLNLFVTKYKFKNVQIMLQKYDCQNSTVLAINISIQIDCLCFTRLHNLNLCIHVKEYPHWSWCYMIYVEAPQSPKGVHKQQVNQHNSKRTSWGTIFNREEGKGH